MGKWEVGRRVQSVEERGQGRGERINWRERVIRSNWGILGEWERDMSFGEARDAEAVYWAFQGKEG